MSPKSLLVFCIVFFLLAYSVQAIKPEFTELSDGDILHGMQDVRFLSYTGATDAENEYPLNFTYGQNTGSLSSFFFASYNSTHGIFNFTPGNAEVGIHQILLIVKDSSAEANVVLVYFDVGNVNDPPDITWYYPSHLSFGIDENSSVGFFFNYSATDPDIPWGDYLQNEYYFDGANASSNHSWTYRTGFCEPDNHTVKLVVEDSYGLNDSLQWDITHITNVNRRPLFNQSYPLPDLNFPEDTNLLNQYALFPDRFNDLDYYCANRPDTMSFYATGNAGVDVVVGTIYPFYVSFYPERNWDGELNVTLYADDGYSSTHSNTFLINVTPVSDAPVLPSIPNQTVYALTRFYYNVNATDPEGGLVNYSDDTPMFTIGALTGVMDFMAVNSQTGNHTINITATDDESLTNSTTFVLQVKHNHAPFIYHIPMQYVSQNSSFSLNALGGDADGDAITIDINMNGFTKQSYTSSSANFSFIPILNGTFNVIVNVTDIHGAINYSVFLLNVSYINIPPRINPIPPQVAKIGKVYEFNVTASDGNGGIETLTFSDNTSLFAINSSSGRVSFSPSPAQKGNYTVNISVWDSGSPPLNAWQSVEYEVTYNRPPVIFTEPGLQVSWEDFPFNLLIEAYDRDNDPMVFSDNTPLFDIDPNTGNISFVPNQSVANQTYEITINVSDVDNAWDSVTFTLRINSTNSPPYFDPPLEEVYNWSLVPEGRTHLIYINVSDEENDPIVFNLEWIDCTVNNSCRPPFNLTLLSSRPGRVLINFSPEDRDIGLYYFNLSASDLVGNVNYSVIMLNISNLNDAPEILRVYPFGRPLGVYTTFAWANVSEFLDTTVDFTYLNISEGRRIIFNHTSWDVDTDDSNLYYRWTIDGEEVSQRGYLSHYFDYESSGEKHVMLNVSDDEGADTTFMWNLSILDVNQPPVFGQKFDNDYDTLARGSFNKTVINSTGWVCLQKSLGLYYPSGSFTSRIIDLEARDLLKVGWLNYSARAPAETELSFRTRGSANNITWMDWSEGFDPTIDGIKSGDYRFLQYKIGLRTNNQLVSPCFNAIGVNYSIWNFTLKNNNIYSSVLHLDEFFYDIDPGENLTFGADQYLHMTVTIEDDFNVRIEPDGDYFGQDSLRFWASDGDVTTYSNLVDVQILQGTGTGTSSETQSSSTRVLVQTQVKKEKETKYAKFKLIAPEETTVYENESVMIPIKLTNPTNETLLDIFLNASTDQKVNFTFSKREFTQLRKGESINTTLWMTPFKIAGTYEVVITGIVREPSTNDSVKVMINSREKGEHNVSQINTKIAFTQDLLGSHPECLELNELLREAADAMQYQQYAKAEAIINKVASDCSYLISSTEANVEQPKTTGNTIRDILSDKGVLKGIGIGLVMVMLFGFFLLYKKT